MIDKPFKVCYNNIMNDPRFKTNDYMLIMSLCRFITNQRYCIALYKNSSEREALGYYNCIYYNTGALNNLITDNYYLKDKQFRKGVFA